jgi:hypothetical protein
MCAQTSEYNLVQTEYSSYFAFLKRSVELDISKGEAK